MKKRMTIVIEYDEPKDDGSHGGGILDNIRQIVTVIEASVYNAVPSSELRTLRTQ